MFVCTEGCQHSRTSTELGNKTRREQRSMICEVNDTRSQKSTQLEGQGLRHEDCARAGVTGSSRSFHHTWQVPRNRPSNQMFLHVKELRGSGDVLRKCGHPQLRVYSTGEVFFVQSEALLCAHASTKRSVIEGAAKLGQGHRLAKDAKMQTHIHQTVCENEYSTLLLVKVPVAVHIDISSSLGLRCPPLIVLCRPGISVLTSSSAVSLFYGTYSCVMISMSRRTSVLRMKIAHAWRRLLELNCRILSPRMLQRSDQVASRSNWVVS